MDPEKIMVGISDEIELSLKAMAKAKTPEDKLKYSETIKNLCESLGIFLSLMQNIADYDDEEM